VGNGVPGGYGFAFGSVGSVELTALFRLASICASVPMAGEYIMEIVRLEVPRAKYLKTGLRKMTFSWERPLPLSAKDANTSLPFGFG